MWRSRIGPQTAGVRPFTKLFGKINYNASSCLSSSHEKLRWNISRFMRTSWEISSNFPQLLRGIYGGVVEFMCLTFIWLYFAFYLLKRTRADICNLHTYYIIYIYIFRSIADSRYLRVNTSMLITLCGGVVHFYRVFVAFFLLFFPIRLPVEANNASLVLILMYI